MKKILKYFLIIVASLFLLLCGLIALIIYDGREDAEISLLTNEDRLIIPIEIDGKTYPFLWDTGAEGSTIDYKLAYRLGYEGTSFEYGELFGVRAIAADTFAFDSIPISLGNINIKTSFRLDGNRRYFPFKGYDSTKFVGIIGQNIIFNYRWLFNFKENKVRIYNYKKDVLEEPEDDIFKLNFTGYCPMVDICVNERDTFNFMFDTGLKSLGSHQLADKEHLVRHSFVFTDSISKFIRQNPKGLVVETSGKDEPFIFIIDSLQLNDRMINPVAAGANYTIPHESLKDRNFITIDFVRRFRQMYYNPRKKEISFYVSPQDSAFVYRGQEEREFLDLIKRNYK